MYQFNEQFTWTKGRHTMKFGADLRWLTALRHPAEVIGSRDIAYLSSQSDDLRLTKETSNVAGWVHAALLTEQAGRGSRRATAGTQGRNAPQLRAVAPHRQPAIGRDRPGLGAIRAEIVRRRDEALAAIEAGKVSVEYRMRSFLGPESVRAVNALAAAQADGRFDALRQALYVNQPKERTGGFTTQTLLDLGRAAGLTSSTYTNAVRDVRYESWVRKVDDQASRDGNVATPELRIGDRVLTQQELFDPASLRRALGL